MSSTLSPSQRQHFPTVARYLDQLPSGIDSYPQYQAKASLLHSVLADHSLVSVADALPSVLSEMIIRPPPLSGWLSEVHFRCIIRVVLDAFFRDRRKFVTWSYDAQHKLLSGPVYGLLFTLLSPERGLKVGATRWAAFHKGMTVDIVPGEHSGRVTFRFAAHLFDDLDHEVTLAGLRVAIELMGARGVRVMERTETATSASALMQWR